MSRLCRYILNKMYTTCQSIRGVKTASGSTIHYCSEIRNKRNVSIGRASILYKKQSVYISKSGRFSMGKDSHVAPYGYFLIEGQSVSIGDDVAIGPRCSFFCSSNTYSAEKPLFRENYTRGDISVGNNVFIGAHCVILPGSEISDDTIIAANSLVKGKLEGGWLYGGSPCKPIKKLSEDD